MTENFELKCIYTILRSRVSEICFNLDHGGVFFARRVERIKTRPPTYTPCDDRKYGISAVVVTRANRTQSGPRQPRIRRVARPCFAGKLPVLAVRIRIPKCTRHTRSDRDENFRQPRHLYCLFAWRVCVYVLLR